MLHHAGRVHPGRRRPPRPLSDDRVRLGASTERPHWYADAIYTGITATVPYKRSKHRDLTGYEQTVNRKISTRRSAVERAIGHFKNW
ncbi:transposase family protein [Kribbella sp. NPDC026611]|uniref:transposase family protein n=1 Tax=Kribbella sp. NPDC026611 TaxID=3154911 RepID=UPI0033CF4CCA